MATSPIPSNPQPAGDLVSGLLKQLQEMQAKIDKLSENQPKEETPDTTEHTYYHRVPGSKITVLKKGEDGTKFPVSFNFNHRGELTTTDPDVNAFMKKIVGKPGCPIFEKPPVDKKDPLMVKASQEVIQSAARSIDKMGAEAGKPQG